MRYALSAKAWVAPTRRRRSRSMPRSTPQLSESSALKAIPKGSLSFAPASIWTKTSASPTPAETRRKAWFDSDNQIKQRVAAGGSAVSHCMARPRGMRSPSTQNSWAAIRALTPGDKATAAPGNRLVSDALASGPIRIHACGRLQSCQSHRHAPSAGTAPSRLSGSCR